MVARYARSMEQVGKGSEGGRREEEEVRLQRALPTSLHLLFLQVPA